MLKIKEVAIATMFNWSLEHNGELGHPGGELPCLCQSTTCLFITLHLLIAMTKQHAVLKWGLFRISTWIPEVELWWSIRTSFLHITSEVYWKARYFYKSPQIHKLYALRENKIKFLYYIHIEFKIPMKLNPSWKC